MNELKDESVHLVVTSPPYWQLKDYGTENQIGYGINPEFISNFYWAFPYWVGLSVSIFCLFLTKGFPLQSLRQHSV
ncbi:MAG: hypothetical protein WAV89_07100 [Ignavibacteriaceae bacterium]